MWQIELWRQCMRYSGICVEELKIDIDIQGE